MLQVAMKTKLSQKELEELGFSTSLRDAKNGLIYHIQKRDEVLNINTYGNSLFLDNYSNEEIIEAIEDNFIDADESDRLEFISELAKALS